LRRHFEFRADWYRGAAASVAAVVYYSALRSALWMYPEARRCRVRCAECGIFFLSDPRNLHLAKQRCPFGCRQAHRREASTRRSAAYYRTLDGRVKRHEQNRRRNRQRSVAVQSEAPPVVESPPIDGTMLSHLVMSTSLLEGRCVTPAEILSWWENLWRQRTTALGRRMDYVVQRLREERPDD
jgi:hypothetical protein